MCSCERVVGLPRGFLVRRRITTTLQHSCVRCKRCNSLPRHRFAQRRCRWVEATVITHGQTPVQGAEHLPYIIGRGSPPLIRSAPLRRASMSSGCKPRRHTRAPLAQRARSHRCSRGPVDRLTRGQIQSRAFQIWLISDLLFLMHECAVRWPVSGPPSLSLSRPGLRAA